MCREDGATAALKPQSNVKLCSKARKTTSKVNKTITASRLHLLATATQSRQVIGSITLIAAARLLRFQTVYT